MKGRLAALLGVGLAALAAALLVGPRLRAVDGAPVQLEPQDLLLSELPRPIRAVAHLEEEPPARAAAPAPPSAPAAVAAPRAADPGCPGEPAAARLDDLLRERRVEAALELVGESLRCGSAAAPRALDRVTSFLVAEIGAGRWVPVEAAEGALEKLPVSHPRVRPALVRVLGELAHAELGAADFDRAEQHARAARALDETDANVIAVLGELELHRGDDAAALETCQRGLRLHPDSRRLAGCVAKVEREQRTLAASDRLTSPHFVLSFEGSVDAEGARPTLETLEQAYREVGDLFHHFPAERLPVILYPGQSYSRGELHPAWSAGVYDGKIRVVSGGATGQTLLFRGLMFHEYAHALFQRVTRGVRAPAWLNEGLAEVAKQRADPSAPVPCSAGHGLPLGRLTPAFGQLGRAEASRAYPEARHAVERLIARGGEDSVRTLLTETGERGDFERAFQAVYGESPASFAASFDAEGRSAR